MVAVYVGIERVGQAIFRGVSSQSNMGTLKNPTFLNYTVNTTTDGEAVELHKAVVGGLLLPVVALVIVLDLLVMAAVIADAEIVRSIRWILGNILTSSMIKALGLLLLRLFQLGEFHDSELAKNSLTTCKVYIPVATLGNSGEVLMATFYCITVFVVVRWWNEPVLAPRNAKYFVITTGFLWICAIILTVSTFVPDVIKRICSTYVNAENIPQRATTALFLSFSIFPLLLTIPFLVITICFIKRRTITETTAAKKALLKFGFFLAIVQGINVITQVIIPTIILLLTSNDRPYSLALTITIAIYDLSLIPIPILICIFFKTVQLKLRKWLCSCCNKCSSSADVSTLQDAS